MTLAAAELAKIAAFIDGLRFSAPDILGKKEASARAYRRFHGLLLWGLLIEKTTASHKEFARECLADASSSFFLTLISFYKPSLLCLRSAIENFLRFMVSLDGIDPGLIGTVHQLFAESKKKHAMGTIERPFLDKLHAQYALLCRTSHTTKVDYMSMEVPFSRLNVHSSPKADENLRRIDLVCTQILNLTFCHFHRDLHQIGVGNADLARSFVPRSLRRAVSNRE